MDSRKFTVDEYTCILEQAMMHHRTVDIASLKADKIDLESVVPELKKRTLNQVRRCYQEKIWPTLAMHVAGKYIDKSQIGWVHL